MSLYFIKCYLLGDNLTAKMGYNDSKYLLEEAGDRFEICPVAIDLSAGRRLSDDELKYNDIYLFYFLNLFIFKSIYLILILVDTHLLSDNHYYLF